MFLDGEGPEDFRSRHRPLGTFVENREVVPEVTEFGDQRQRVDPADTQAEQGGTHCGDDQERIEGGPDAEHAPGVEVLERHRLSTFVFEAQ